MISGGAEPCLIFGTGRSSCSGVQVRSLSFTAGSLLLFVAFLVLWSPESRAGINTWTNSSYPECESPSLTTFAQCMADAKVEEVQPNAAHCSNTYDVDYGPSGGPPTYTAGGDVFRQNWTVASGCFGGPVDAGGWSGSFTVDGCDFNEATGECAELSCAEDTGRKVSSSYSGAFSASGCTPGPDSGLSCQAEAQGVSVTLGGKTLTTYELTGEVCDDGDPIENPVVLEDDRVNCVSSGGVSVCADTAAQNCGTVNGDDVCFDAVPDGNCVFTANGGMVCDSDSGSPPAPTESDGTTAAAPDATIGATTENSTTNNYNYYGPGTVAGSGTATSGEGEGGQGSSETGSETGEGEEGEVTAGDVPELAEVDTFGEATSAFVGRIQASPIITAVSGLGATMPEGVCPTPEATLAFIGGTTITLDAHCSLWENIGGVISGVMLAVFVFLGARVLVSA